MSCEGAALPFQAHANYGNWSIDFDHDNIVSTQKYEKKSAII